MEVSQPHHHSGLINDNGSWGLGQMTTEEQIMSFKSSNKPNNITNVNAWQISQLLYRIVAPWSSVSGRKYEPLKPDQVCTKAEEPWGENQGPTIELGDIMRDGWKNVHFHYSSPAPSVLMWSGWHRSSTTPPLQPQTDFLLSVRLPIPISVSVLLRKARQIPDGSDLDHQSVASHHGLCWLDPSLIQ